MVFIVDHDTIVPFNIGRYMGLELRELGKHFTKNFGMVFWLGIFRIKPVEFDIYFFLKSALIKRPMIKHSQKVILFYS